MALFDMDGHASAAELGRTSRVDVSWTFTDTSILLQSTGLPFHSYGNPSATRTASAQNYEVQIIYRGGTNEKGSGNDAIIFITISISKISKISSISIISIIAIISIVSVISIISIISIFSRITSFPSGFSYTILTVVAVIVPTLAIFFLIFTLLM